MLVGLRLTSWCLLAGDSAWLLVTMSGVEDVVAGGCWFVGVVDDGLWCELWRWWLCCHWQNVWLAHGWYCGGFGYFVNVRLCAHVHCCWGHVCVGDDWSAVVCDAAVRSTYSCPNYRIRTPCAFWPGSSRSTDISAPLYCAPSSPCPQTVCRTESNDIGDTIGTGGHQGHGVYCYES